MDRRKECVAVLIELYENNVSVSCVGSHFRSDWALYTADIYLDWIWSLANINRNCNTFFHTRKKNFTLSTEAITTDITLHSRIQSCWLTLPTLWEEKPDLEYISTLTGLQILYFLFFSSRMDVSLFFQCNALNNQCFPQSVDLNPDKKQLKKKFHLVNNEKCLQGNIISWFGRNCVWVYNWGFSGKWMEVDLRG